MALVKVVGVSSVLELQKC